MPYEVPNIGDLIRFTDKWTETFSDNAVPVYGIVYKICTVLDLQYEDYDDKWFQTTLAYPVTLDTYEASNTYVYFVYWFTVESFIAATYNLINEEWFAQDLFVIVSKIQTS